MRLMKLTNRYGSRVIYLNPERILTIDTNLVKPEITEVMLDDRSVVQVEESVLKASNEWAQARSHKFIGETS